MQILVATITVIFHNYSNHDNKVIVTWKKEDFSSKFSSGRNDN